MSQVGLRVKLEHWPYGGILYEGMYGTITSEGRRGIVIQWDGMKRPMGMSFEEVALA